MLVNEQVMMYLQLMGEMILKEVTLEPRLMNCVLILIHQKQAV
jgi:hypothetical protein